LRVCEISPVPTQHMFLPDWILLSLLQLGILSIVTAGVNARCASE
jgi:hypothetical protein